MTKTQAKRESLRVWRYLRDHPEIDKKSKLPKELLNIIQHYENQCPMCEYFMEKNFEFEPEDAPTFEGLFDTDCCKGCPLYYKSVCYQFRKWNNDYGSKIYNDKQMLICRYKAAKRIEELLVKW